MSTFAPTPSPTIASCFDDEEGGGMVGPFPKWIIGVVFGLLGSIAINTGNNIQSLGLMKLEADVKRQQKEKQIREMKKQHNNDKGTGFDADADDDDDEDDDEDDYIATVSPGQSRTWVIGTFVFVTGSLMNFASYPFAPQSMLASLESVQFVSNLIFGKIMHGAEVTGKMWFGTAITLAGTVTAVSFSSKVALSLRIDDLIEMWLEPMWIAYLICMGGALVTLSTTYKIYAVKKESGSPFAGSHILMPIMYAVWSALFGTLSVCQAKVLGELLASNGPGPCQDQVFAHWFTYASILLWVCTVGVWLYRLNDALSKFNPLFIIPLLQCMFIFFAIVAGGIFFQEFNDFTAGQWVGFVFGVAVMFSGLVFLVPIDDESEELPTLPQEVLDMMKEHDEAAGSSPVNCGGSAQERDESTGISMQNPAARSEAAALPVVNLPPPVPANSPPSSPVAAGKKLQKAASARDAGGTGSGGGKRKSIALDLGEGLANLIAGGALVVGTNEAAKTVVTVGYKTLMSSSASELRDGKAKGGTRRMSMGLAGAMMQANLDKQHKKEEVLEARVKMRKASNLYTEAQAKGEEGGNEVWEKVRESLDGVCLSRDASEDFEEQVRGNAGQGRKKALSFVGEGGEEVTMVNVGPLEQGRKVEAMSLPNSVKVEDGSPGGL